MPHSIGRRARAAVLAEFALVGPVFIAMIFMILQLSFWAYDREALAIASRTGARAAVVGEAGGYGSVPGAAEVSRILSSRVEIVTPALPAALSSGVFPATASWSACLRARNAPDVNVHGRLGWDWGCQPGNLALAAGALRTGIDATVDQLFGSRAIWLGPHGPIEIVACYMAITSTGADLCVYRMTARVSSTGSLSATPVAAFPAGINPRTAPAPSYVQVTIRGNAPTLVGVDVLGIVGLTLEAAGASWIDRFRPPCPPPTTAEEYVPGRCGGVH